MVSWPVIFVLVVFLWCSIYKQYLKIFINAITNDKIFQMIHLSQNINFCLLIFIVKCLFAPKIVPDFSMEKMRMIQLKTNLYISGGFRGGGGAVPL